VSGSIDGLVFDLQVTDLLTSHVWLEDPTITPGESLQGHNH